MELLKRQAITYEVYDDQSPELWGKYAGNWTRYTRQPFYNYTFTATPTLGALVSFTFSGSQAWVYGGVLNTNQTEDFPTANYIVDGTPAGPQTPYYYSSQLIYFQTPKLRDGTHTINITVTGANSTNQYILDYITITPSEGGSSSSSGMMTTTRTPASTSITAIVTTQSTPVGPIVGGVVGGIAGIAIVIIAVYFFMIRRARGRHPYYFEKSSRDNVLAAEAHVEPFNPTTANPPPSAGFDPHPRYYGGSSNRLLNQSVTQTTTSLHPSQPTHSGPTDAGLTYSSDNRMGPRTGKAALLAQRENVQEPVQYQDSGIRFNMGREQEAGPSQPPTEVPPTYTPN